MGLDSVPSLLLDVRDSMPPYDPSLAARILADHTPRSSSRPGTREYDEERLKKGLSGLTPSANAMQLTARTKTAKVTAGL